MSDELREETGYALTLFPTNCSPSSLTTHHSLLIVASRRPMLCTTGPATVTRYAWSESGLTPH